MITLTLTLTSYDDDDNETEQTLELPAQWAICQACEGSGGAPPAGLRGHVYTQEDFDADPSLLDFCRDLSRGVYNEPCEACKGSGKVKVVEITKIEDDRVRAAVRRHLRETRAQRALERSERRGELAMAGDLEGFNAINCGGGW